VDNGTGPSCTVRVPIVFVNNKPDTIPLDRNLLVIANANLVDGPAGSWVKTGVQVGYPTGLGAIVTITVVDSKGKRIQGVSVVGSSGRIYE